MRRWNGFREGQPVAASRVPLVMTQFSLFDGEGRPEGLRYEPDFLSAAEERELLARVATLAFRPFEYQGFLGKRETISFGWSYRFDGGGLAEAAPLPLWLLPVRARAAAFAGLKPEALVQALVIRYGEGAGLGWHRDRPVFDDVLGLSLLSAAPLRFRRRAGEKWQRFTLETAPGSLYLLRGPSRTEWQHSLAPVSAPRYAITFRSMR